MSGAPLLREEPAGEELARRVAPPDTDEIFGRRYRRVRRIGTGGMADVYEVEHVTLGARFAAKVLRPGRDAWENAVRRFVREARLLGKLQSDHIVRVTDLDGIEGERPFYVMELLDGQDLRALLRKTDLSLARAVKIVADACEGVRVAHAAGLVHRDLKPENLFVTYRDSGEEVCKLLDFGVSKACEPTTTETGALIGTVTYMAPEQIESAGTVTARADVYALGAILYETLAGRPPHVADSVERLLFAILNGEPEPVAAHRTGVPHALDRVVLRALARDPANRFASVADFAHALAPFSSAAELTTNATGPDREPSEPVRGDPRSRRGPGLLVALVSFVAGLIALAAFAQSRSLVPASSPDARPAVPLAVPLAASPPLPTPAEAVEVASASAQVAPALAQPESAVSPPVAPAKKPSSSSRPRPAGARRTGAPVAPSASAAATSHTTAAPLPKIQFDLRNPYGG
ncbi:MAG TPA: protein kinase [Polyangiaceae bacterium]|nr:protein kinase [Polyangiaceae bacterium]